MSVIFKEKDKTMELDIVDYESAYDENSDWYDVNWLTAKITYEAGTHKAVYYDNCLLTSELEEMTEDIKKLIDGEETGVMPYFIEPNLSFSAQRNDEIYAVHIRFIYDMKDGWKDVYAAAQMSGEEIEDIYVKMKELCSRFPERKVKSED